MATVGQCHTNPVTGVSGDIWNAWTTSGVGTGAGLNAAALVSGSATRAMIALQIEAHATAIVANMGGGGVSTGTYAGRPAAATAGAGALYFCVDGGDAVHNGVCYQSTGTVWAPIRYDRRDQTAAVIRWKLNEAAGATTVASSGSLANQNLTIGAGGHLGQPGPFGYGLDTGQLSTGVVADKAYGAGANGHGAPSVRNLTLNVWGTFLTQASFRVIVSKAYRNDGTWNVPFSSISLYVNGSAIEYSIATGAGVHTAATTGTVLSAMPQRMMLTLAFDGINLLGYVNAIQSAIATVAVTDIDYGTDGWWGIGGRGSSAGDANELPTGIQIFDVSMFASTYTQAQIAALYARGAGEWGGV